MARSTIPVEARCGSNATLTTARDPSSNDTTTGGSAAATGGSVATSTVTAPRARPGWPCTPSHSSAADLLAASPVTESTSTTWSASASSPGRTAAASSAPTSTTTTFSSPTAAAAAHASNGASGSTARTVGRCGSVPVPPGDGGGSRRAARPPAYGVASTTATRSGCSAASASPSSTAVVVAPTSSRSAATTIRRGRSRARAGLIQLLTGSALPTAGTSLAARSPTLVIGPASPPAPAPAADRRYREPGEGATAVRRAQAPTATTRLGGRVTTRRRPWAGRPFRCSSANRSLLTVTCQCRIATLLRECSPRGSTSIRSGSVGAGGVVLGRAARGPGGVRWLLSARFRPVWGLDWLHVVVPSTDRCVGVPISTFRSGKCSRASCG